MDSVDGLVHEFGALLCGVVDADAFDGFGLAVGAGEGADEFGGVASAGGEFCHALHALE